MKNLTNISKWITLLFLSTFLATFIACEKDMPLSGLNNEAGNNDASSNIEVLSFKGKQNSLNKIVDFSKWVTVQNGGYLPLEYGSTCGASGSYLFGVSEDSPYEIYMIDPLNAASSQPVGQLAFKTRAIALQPEVDPIEPPADSTEEFRVLFVADDASSLSQAEITRIQLMESWGFTVNAISAAASQTEFDNAVLNSDVAFIYEGIDDTDLNTKLVQTTIGIVSEEVRLIDEFGIGSNYVWAYTRDLSILDASHYITSAFPSGVVSMFTTNLAIPYFSQYLAPGLDALGKYSTYYGPSLLALEKGASLYGGGAAAGRRVQLPMGNYGYDFSLLSSDGKALLLRCFEWAANKEGFNPGGGTALSGSGLVYYVAKDKVDNIYRVAAWDPATGNNTILPIGTTIRPSDKLTFGPDGKLYGVNKDDSDEIYTINTTTGEWTLLAVLNNKLSDKGDLAFSPDGTLYNTDDKKLYKVDLNSNSLIEIAQLPDDKVTGIGFLRNGLFYFSRENGEIFTLDKNTCAGYLIGDTGINKLHDLTSYVGELELFYCRVTLNIPAGSISEDAEVSLSLETSEILGGVSVTFNPHGTTFNSSALLNVEAYGVDFTGVNPNDVNVFYDNPNTGVWELMQSENITIDVNTGYINVVNAELPHFSRYAIGTEN